MSRPCAEQLDMAPRLARSSIQTSAAKNVRAKHKKRNLDAYAIASHTADSNPRIRKNRLGEYLDDAPKQKRRRLVTDQDENDEESVDEEVPAGPKRKRTADEDAAGGDEGSDSEGNEWRLGGMRSDDEDSELDSDEAFGESDEEKFEGFTFRGSKSGGGKATKSRAVPAKGAARTDDINLEEDEQEAEDGEEDDFGDEGVDLATMLDDDVEEILGGKATTGRDIGDESESEEEEGENSDPEIYEESDEDDDRHDEERAARMQDRLEALEPVQARPSTKSTSAPLNDDDLLATLDPASRKQAGAVQKARKKSSQAKTASAPLPKRQQDRLNREVATQKAKEQLDRWRDTVIQNRRAEFLSFPLKHNDEVEPVGKDSFIVDGKPQNELEESIQRIMQESGLSTTNGQSKAGEDEAGILKAEDLAVNKLPVEEVMRRRAELRRTRDLLFREERKAKRIAKIKSRSYRRVHRKERERQAQLEGELMGSGDDDERREADDRKRAMARMSTKHRDSKFAKALTETSRGVWDEGAREAILDEARRRDELERRIRGDDVRGDEDRSGIESEDDDYEQLGGFDDHQDKSTLKQLIALESNGTDGGVHQEEKGLQGLKFMRTADERRRAQNDEDVERLRKELAVQDGDEEGSDDDDAIDNQALGRAVFAPKGKTRAEKNKAKRPEMDEGEESESSAVSGEEDVAFVTEKPVRNGAPRPPGSKASRQPSKANALYDRIEPSAFSNGTAKAVSSWITGDVTKQPHAKSEWRTAKTDRGRVTNEEPINVDISDVRSESYLNPPRKGAEMLANMNYKKSDEKTASKGTNDFQDSALQQHASRKGIGFDTHILDMTKEYHARAFAGDDTTAGFAAEKSALAQDEDEKEESTALPGWGSWTGGGLSRSLRRANARQRHNPLYKTKTPGVAQANRKDAALENVIISEKTDRKGKGYLAPILPHGFETKEQYERSLRLPVGPEWSTKEVFQRGTRPRVVVKPGSVIEAMERPMV